jgi:hypothetical protein
LSFKYTYIDVQKIINDLGFTLISQKYENSKQKLVLKDEYGYFYLISLNTLSHYKNSKKFHKSNPYTIQNIKLWCKLNDKPFELITNTYTNAEEKMKWKCLKDNCGEFFYCCLKDISQGVGCGVCHGFQVTLSNCLATKRPDLAAEWHPTKNGKLMPYDVTCGSNIEVWWQCSKNPKHEWETPIYTRVNNIGCPYCAGKLPSEDYNLLLINPTLCKDWNYEKNKNRPNDYTPNSSKQVWWKCKECGNEWKASICSRNRTNGTGCPECNKSKGEKRIKDYLNLQYIYYNEQKEFNGLLGLGNKNLSYDFYLPRYNLLIEFQGVQHEKYILGFHKSKKDFQKQVEHDKRKREYAQTNNIKLLEIWYNDFENIEFILQKELNLKEVILIA